MPRQLVLRSAEEEMIKMKKNILLAALVLLLCLSLCACRNRAPASTPTPAPTPAPVVPTPEPTPAPSSWTVTDETSSEILALADIPSLETIDATACSDYDALLELRGLRPDCEIRWNYEFQGKSYPNSTTELKVTDLTGLEDAIRYLPELEYIDLIETDATVEDLDRYDAIRPGIFYYWSFPYGRHTIRTDIEVFSTQRDGYNHRYTNEELYPLLKYCKHLKSLDLGHNAITDVSLIGGLTELEALILSGNPFEDASPLGKLSNLTYLELFSCLNIQDFSFLRQLTRIQEINLCYDYACTSLDFLENMPDFRFGMFKYSGITSAEYWKWIDKFPEATAVLSDGNYDSFEFGWREGGRNHQIRYILNGWSHVTDYRSCDDADLDFSRVVY